MRQVASVAVTDNQGRILMGMRKDNGRWTLPGGHLESGESAHDGALRELFEESGISAHQLYPLTNKIVTTPEGEKIAVYAFQYSAQPEDVTTVHDPDDEVHVWEWVDIRKLPERISCNLHNKHDVVLEYLGVTKSMEFVVSTKLVGLYIAKAGSHKYLRKYKDARGRWRYIYHEADNHGREVPEKLIKRLKQLSKHDTAEGRRAQALLDTMQEHSQEKINAMLALARDHGETTPGRNSQKHLKRLGIDHKQSLDDIMDPPTAWDAELSEDAYKVAQEALISSVNEKVYRYLDGHRSSPYAMVLQGHSIESLREALDDKKDLKSMLIATHNHLAEIDRRHEGLPQSQNGEAREAGGYGNHAWNHAMDKLSASDVVSGENAIRLKEGRSPDTFGIMWNETSASHASHVDGAADRILRRAEQERQRRAEVAAREQREQEAGERARRELDGSMASFVASMTQGGMSTTKQTELQNFFNRAFSNRPDGQTLRAEDFPYNFSENGANVEIKSVAIWNKNTISFGLVAKDSRGRQITSSWNRRWTILDSGGVEIYNSLLEVVPSMRGSVKIGALINKSQQDFLKKYSPEGQIRVTAALDVGGYNWANQGFEFTDRRGLIEHRQGFKQFCARHGVELSNDDMQNFTLPCHFSSFDVGVYVEKNINGKTVPVHLGKAYLLGKDWSGIQRVQDMNDENPAYRFFQKYSDLKREAWTTLDQPFRDLVTRNKQGRQASGNPQTSRGPPPVARPSSIAARIGDGVRAINVQRARAYIDNVWATPNGENIRMTNERISEVVTWSVGDIKAFLALAPLTRASKARIVDHPQIRQRLARGREL